MSDTPINKDVGPVSGYAVAVEHGYTGTEEEWIQLVLQGTANAQTAAAAAASAAQNRQTAVAAAQAAGGSQTAAAGSASAAAVSATAAAGSASAAASSETNAAASATAAAASEAAAKRVEESIPADYTELTGEVSELKSDVDQLSQLPDADTGKSYRVEATVSAGHLVLSFEEVTA